MDNSNGISLSAYYMIPTFDAPWKAGRPMEMRRLGDFKNSIGTVGVVMVFLSAARFGNHFMDMRRSLQHQRAIIAQNTRFISEPSEQKAASDVIKMLDALTDAYITPGCACKPDEDIVMAARKYLEINKKIRCDLAHARYLLGVNTK